MSLDKLFQGTWGLRRDTLRHEFLRLRYILTWRTHLYILLHKRVLVILQFILHPLGAAPVLSSLLVSYLLWPNYSLYTAFGDSGRWSLIINSSHILIGRTVAPRYLLILHQVLLILSLLSLIAALLLHVHLHRGVVVWVIRIEVWLHQTIAWWNVSARASTATWQDCSVAWRCTIAIAMIRSAHAEIGILHVYSLKCVVFFGLLIAPIIVKVIGILLI